MLGKSAHNPPKSGRMPRRCPDGDLRPPAEWKTKKAAPAARSGQKGPEGAAGAAADAPGARGTRPAGAVLPEKSVRGTARRLPGAQLPAGAGQTFQQLHKAEGERRKAVLFQQVEQIFDQCIHEHQLKRFHHRVLPEIYKMRCTDWSCKNLFTMLLYNRNSGTVRTKSVNE